MKKIILLFALFFGLSSAVSAQQKLGHINSDELLALMPETKLAQAELEKYGQQLEKDMGEMETELSTKIEQFRTNEPMMTTTTRELKTKELQDLQGRIQQFSQRAQQDIQQKQVDLFQPIIEKASKAIEDVAREKGFTYILDSSQSKAVVVFAENGEDIMPLVKAKLGIQ
ncbi:MAG: OmpH family outer membrane protein [Croceimicrobium sp.]|nr:OmpH family outer membrane protein [Bacteroidota bacterium]